MGYLDSFADPLFKTDAEGRTVFFPNGKLGRGRIVPDATTALRLRNTVKFGTPVLIVLVVAAFTGFGLAVGVPVAIAAFVVYQLYLQAQVRGLAYSDATLTFSEIRQRQADALGRGWLLALTIGSAVLAASGLAVIIFDREEMGIGVLATVFFGVCLIAFLYLLRIRSRST